jgi:hypothetical protein
MKSTRDVLADYGTFVPSYSFTLKIEQFFHDNSGISV